MDGNLHCIRAGTAYDLCRAPSGNLLVWRVDLQSREFHEQPTLPSNEGLYLYKSAAIRIKFEVHMLLRGGNQALRSYAFTR